MNLSKIDMNLLVVFASLANHRSVTKAAQELSLSQPALSHALNRLRHTFNDELFIRSPKGMIPTQKTLELAPKITPLLEELSNHVFIENTFDPNTSDMIFRICGTENEQLTHIKRVIQVSNTKAPSIRFKLSTPHPPTFFDHMDAGKIDLAFTVNAPSNPHLVYEDFYEEELVCLVKKGMIQTKKMSLKSYLEYDHILVAPLGGETGPIDDALKEAGKERTIGIIVPNFCSVPFYLQERELIFTCPKRYAKELKRNFNFDEFKLPFKSPKFTVQMVWHKRTDRAPAYEWLRQSLRDALKDIS